MSRILSRLRSLALPVMPETARRVRALLADPRSTHEELESALLRDPGATLALYRTVERIRPGAADRLTGPAHALSMIGREAFRRRFETLDTLTARPLRHLLSPAFAWSQAAHAGWYAARMAQALGFSHPVEIRVAALLQHPAVLALWVHDFESAARATQAVRDGVGFSTAFTAELGMPLREADRALAREWRLPALAREVVGDWDPASRRPQTVSLAARLALVAAAGWPEEETRLHTEVLSGLLPGHHHDAGRWWRRETVEAARRLHDLGYPLPARELLLLPGGEPEPVTLPDLPSLRDRPVPRPAPRGPGARLLEHLREIRRALGVARVILVLPDRQGRRLQARLADGGPDDALRRLDLPLRERHLLSLLLTRPRAVFMGPADRERHAELLRPPLDTAAARGLLAQSVFDGRRPLGLLLADGEGCAPDRLDAFRQAGRRLALALTALRNRAA